MSTDYEKISNVLAKYCFVVDVGSVDEIVALFWSDACLEFNGVHRGEQEIRRCYEDWNERLRSPVEGLRHLLHTPLIEIDGNLAQAQSYADADAHATRTGKPIQNRAMFRDKLSKRQGEWRFSERRIVWMRGINETQ